MQCYADYIKPGGPLRAKLSVQVASQRCIASGLPGLTSRSLPTDITLALIDEFSDARLDEIEVEPLEEQYPLGPEDASLPIDAPSVTPPAEPLDEDENDLIAASMADIAPAVIGEEEWDSGKLSSVPEEPQTPASIAEPTTTPGDEPDETEDEAAEPEEASEHGVAMAETLAELLAARPTLSTIELRAGSAIAERALEVLDDYEHAQLDPNAMLIDDANAFRASLALPPIAVPV